MPHYNIVIETSAGAGGMFRAEVVDGPDWLRSAGLAVDKTAGSAYGQLALKIRRQHPKRTFDFMHVEAT